MLVAVAAVSVAQSTREFRDVRGARMIAVAENTASTPIVRDRFADPFAEKILAPEVDRAVALSGAGLAEISTPTGRCGCRRIRRASDGGSTWDRAGPTRAAPGSATSTSTGYTAWSARFRSWAPTARCWPIASVSERYPSVWELMGAPASACCSTSAWVRRSGCWRRGCCHGGSNGTPADWRSPRSPAWPIIGKPCCTASARASSR